MAGTRCCGTQAGVHEATLGDEGVLAAGSDSFEPFGFPIVHAVLRGGLFVGPSDGDYVGDTDAGIGDQNGNELVLRGQLRDSEIDLVVGVGARFG